MQKLLEKISTKQLILAIVCLIAAVAVLIVILIAMIPRPQPQSDPAAETTAPPRSYYHSQDFVVTQDGFITCEGATLGIDVSGFQGQIDWQAVKNAGVEFVFIRLGGRGTTEGGLYADNMADTYYRGAKQAGLQVGAYFFSQAISVEEAIEEADFALKLTRHWDPELPVVYDWEWVSSDSRTANMDKDLLTQCTLAFCRQLQKGGRQAMIYFNRSQGLELLELEQLQDFGFWLAQYTDYPDFPHRVDCWQYSCTGSVPGIQGDVDLNLYFPS